jgi:hypothetical protein
MAGKQIVPALGLDSFSCPHVSCGANSHQTWYKSFAKPHADDSKPWMPGPEDVVRIKETPAMDPEVIVFFERLITKEVFFEVRKEWVNVDLELTNVTVSKCYSCGGITIWRADEIIYPLNQISIAPNEGMPPDVRADFLEANDILDKSPRGAAALLRLCVQKLLIHLGEKGKNINDEIGNLVEKGLDRRIQKALDVVRVVGNSAVHPGQIDLNDDKTIATKLFGLVNVIVESQITQAKHIEEMYETIVPETVKAQIEKRDAPKQIEDKSGQG